MLCRSHFWLSEAWGELRDHAFAPVEQPAPQYGIGDAGGQAEGPAAHPDQLPADRGRLRGRCPVQDALSELLRRLHPRPREHLAEGKQGVLLTKLPAEAGIDEARHERVDGHAAPRQPCRHLDAIHVVGPLADVVAP